MPTRPDSAARTRTSTGFCASTPPKRTTLDGHSAQHLLAVEDEINRRPRLVLGDQPPADVFAALLASAT